jgi:hypothetical protein
VVKVLLDNGANEDQTNRQGVTPRDLATKERHRNVLRVLDRCGQNIDITNKGALWTSASAGDAMHEKNQEYLITNVLWITFPLPQKFVRWIGGKHSLLVLSVKAPEGTRQFVLEKAETGDPDAFPNGIMLSTCKDLNTHKFSNTEGKVVHHRIKGASDLQDVTLADAYRYAFDGSKQGDDSYHHKDYQGVPYDLVRSNCHHMALHVLNFCCKSNARCKAGDMPNQKLAQLSPLAKMFASGSKSGSVKSVSTSESMSEQYGFPHMPIEQSSTYVLTRVDLYIAIQCAMLSDWVSEARNPFCSQLTLVP